MTRVKESRIQGRNKLAVCIAAILAALLSTASFAHCEDQIEKLSTDQLSRHFRETVITTRFWGADSSDLISVVRWNRAPIKIVSLAVNRDRLSTIAYGRLRFLTSVFRDGTEIELAKVIYSDAATSALIAKADVILLIGKNRNELQQLMGQSGLNDYRKSSQFEWHVDFNAFGAGCGEALELDTREGRISKAAMLFDSYAYFDGKEPLLGGGLPDNGKVFSCIGKQLIASLGLANQWGKRVTTKTASMFVRPFDFPAYDLATLKLLYREETGHPVSAVDLDSQIKKLAACFSEDYWSCFK